MKLWLDDIRPCPLGYTLALTVPEAQNVVTSAIGRGETFDAASLDHDLGVCAACTGDGVMVVTMQGYVSCAHHGDGSAFVRWMIETNQWPQEKPVVHSANPDGRQRMRGLIDRYGPYVRQTGQKP